MEKVTVEPIEPILRENPDRYSLFPINYPEIWNFYKKAEAATWTADEIDFGADMKDWGELNDDERYFIEHVLAFFAGSDGLVLENLMSTFSTEVQIPEARAFYAHQGYIETVHNETYAKMIDTLVKDTDRKYELFNAIGNIPCVTKKANWAEKWMNLKTRPFRERLIGFIIVEGLFFSGSFCSIFWLKSRGKMINALAKSNEFIARDEGLHTTFGIMLYKLLVTKCDTKTIHDIFKEAVEIEIEFICESLPCRLIDMNSELMIQYIKYVADNLLSELGYPMLYNTECPFDFMDNINLGGKSNFFDQRSSDYSKAYSVSNKSERVFETGDDF
jgi:ribonucleotide reductase beta subunit family protein with ferritin-like domain